MTRKRFIRLVMAEGIQRDQAEEIGERLMLTCQSWEQACRRFEMVKGHLPDLNIRQEDILRFVAERVDMAVKKLGESFLAIALNMRPLAGRRETDDENLCD